MKNNRLNIKNIKRTACVLTAGMMLFTAGAFTGCSENNGDSGGLSNSAQVNQDEVMKTLSYKVSDISIPLGEGETISNVVSKNGLYYGVVSKFTQVGEDYLTSNSIIAFDTTGSITCTIPVFTQEKANEYGGVSGDMYVDDSGNIICLIYRGSYNEETGESTDSLNIVTFDPTGKQIASIDTSNIITSEDEDDNRYFENFIVDAQGNIIMNLNKCVRVCDKDGNVLFTTEDIGGENAWISNLILTNKGVPAIIYYEYTENQSTYKMLEIDVNAKGYGTEYVLNGINVGNVYNGGGDYLLYVDSSTGIIGLKPDTLETESVLNLLNLGVDNSDIASFAINSDGSFAVVNANYYGTNVKSTMTLITPVDSSEVKEKQALTLGCFYLNWNMRSAIASFNKNSEDYVVNTTVYSDTNDTSDYDAALTKFSNEILAGNVPDILIISNSMPYDSYASKGLFADLYELIDKDTELTRDAFMPNVLTALESEGKLYSISPSFSAYTYAAKKSLVGDSHMMTFDKAQEIMASMGENVALTAYDMTTTASDFVSNAIEFSDFIDYDNATCNFDNPEFKAILEYAKKYPNEINYDEVYNNDGWIEQETACRDNRALLWDVYLSDFSGYTRTRDAYFDEDITFVGFPGGSTENTSGGLLTVELQLAISSKSANKDGAWAFIKDILTNNVYEETYYNYSEDGESTEEKRWTSKYPALPTIKADLEKIGAQAVADAQSDEQNGGYTYYVGNQEVKAKPITQADVDMLIEYISSVTHMRKYNDSVNKIIDEECAAFFAGTQTVDVTAANIQSRANIYMSEQYS